jgi:RNA polymerase sigma-70 factor (ECF subfamily)
LVLSVCLNVTGQIAPAQDLSQEVFFRAYCRLADLRRPELFGHWLIGITRLVCKEWKRTRMRDRHQFCELDPVDVAEPTAEDDGFEQVHKAIKTLPEKERLAIQAFYLQGQSVERGQAILGLSRSGFYHVLDRARQRLARLMSPGQEVDR